MAAKKIATRKIAAVPSRGVEISLVAEFPRPAGWGARNKPSGDAREIDLMLAKAWHPTTDDFLEVANVPSRAVGREVTEIIRVTNIGDFLGAILGTKTAGGSPTRPPNSIGRLNLISHGIGGEGVSSPIYGLSGRIDDDGGCFLFPSLAEAGDINRPLLSRGIDEGLVEWLNGSARSLRDECRLRFRDDGEIGLILCNGGGGSFAASTRMLFDSISRTFNVRVRGYNDEISYESTFSGNRFLTRNHTRIGKANTSGSSNPLGVGYFCRVAVPPAAAGKHLEFTNDVAKPKQPKP